MIRPWKVFLSVAVGAAVLPCSAMAQAPTITITSPRVIRRTRRTRTCLPRTAARAKRRLVCGTVAERLAINTAAVGTFPFEVAAKNADGATLTTSVTNYQVTETGQPTIRAAASRPR